MIRLIEPNVRQTFTTDFKNWWRRMFRTDAPLPELIMLDSNLNSFLTSSLNVELVYTILKGISHFVAIP